MRDFECFTVYRLAALTAVFGTLLDHPPGSRSPTSRSVHRRCRRQPNRTPNRIAVGQQPNRRPSAGPSVPEQTPNRTPFCSAPLLVCLVIRLLHCQELDRV